MAKNSKAMLEYIHSQLEGLALMARGSGLDILAYLIDMAVLEAATEIAKGRARK